MIGHDARGTVLPRRLRRARPGCEPLEGRPLLSTGAGYVLSGSSWQNPGHITYSIAPDGVFWDVAANTLTADLTAKFGGQGWRRELARALQTWATVANVDFVQVGDTAAAMDAPGKAQGDPRFGDIRIGGYRYGETTTLAQTYYPPPAGFTQAGDTEINTGVDYKSGSDIDLYSVMLHEFGHALGLQHSPDPSAVMYASYGGVRSGLQPQDIAGIRAIYGARQPDAYQKQGLGTAAASPIDLSAGLDASGKEVVSGVSLETIGDAEFFSVVAPPGATTLQVAAVAGGVSLLSPKLTVVDASGATLGSSADPSSWGDTARVAVGVVPGRRYVFQVTGATNDVFAVGGYQLGVAFNVAIPTPTPSISQAQTPAASPATSPAPAPSATPAIAPDRFGANDSIATATPLGRAGQLQVNSLTLDTAGDVDFFRFQAAKAGVYRATATGMTLRVFDGFGRLFGQANGTILFRAPRAGQRFTIEVSSPDGAPVANYSLAIGPQAAPPVVRRATPARAPKVTRPAAVRHPAGPHALLAGTSHPGRDMGKAPAPQGRGVGA